MKTIILSFYDYSDNSMTVAIFRYKDWFYQLSLEVQKLLHV